MAEEAELDPQLAHEVEAFMNATNPRAAKALATWQSISEQRATC